MNISNQEFGEELLLLNLAKYNDSSSSKIIDSILADIDFHANGFEQSDDITCISISRLYLDSI
jgi:serine phosphatase RsbU (regulator of sigma subunit)